MRQSGFVGFWGKGGWACAVLIGALHVGCGGDSACHLTATCPLTDAGESPGVTPEATAPTDVADDEERSGGQEPDEDGDTAPADDEGEEDEDEDEDEGNDAGQGSEPAGSDTDDEPGNVTPPTLSMLPVIPAPTGVRGDAGVPNEPADAGGNGEVEADACAVCDPLAACEPTGSGAECGACPTGYAGDGTTGCTPTLIGLTASHGALSPELDPGLDVYDLVVPVFIETVTLIPEVPTGAVVTIRGAAIASGATWTSPRLDLGLNSFTLSVEHAGQPSTEYTLRVTRGAAAVETLTASNGESGDSFGGRMYYGILGGGSVALSADGTTLVIGAHEEDSNATGVGGDESNDDAGLAGAVYIFVRNGSSWTQQAYVKASNTQAGDGFGWSLAISGDGNTLAVGALEEDSNATGVNGEQSNDDATGAGAVYVFVRSGSGWAQQAYVKASSAGTTDFGWAVALTGDGSLLAVGGGSDVTILTRSGGTWSPQGTVRGSNSETGDYFGTAVALAADGSTLAVGAFFEGSSTTGTSTGGPGNNDAEGSGAVYVFTRNNNSWSQQAFIKASNTDAGDAFGRSVALSGNGDTLAVGAIREGSNAKGTSGAGQDNNDASSSGAVYVFVRSDSWKQEAYLKASNTEAQDSFGCVVTLSGDGNTLAAGAYLESSSSTGVNGDPDNNDASLSGASYVFTRNVGRWTQQAYIKAPVPSGGFGTSVALSQNGVTLAVAGGPEAVYVYR